VLNKTVFTSSNVLEDQETKYMNILRTVYSSLLMTRRRVSDASGRLELADSTGNEAASQAICFLITADPTS